MSSISCVTVLYLQSVVPYYAYSVSRVHERSWISVTEACELDRTIHGGGKLLTRDSRHVPSLDDRAADAHLAPGFMNSSRAAFADPMSECDSVRGSLGFVR